jgi:hypothetical protein
VATIIAVVIVEATVAVVDAGAVAAADAVVDARKVARADVISLHRNTLHRKAILTATSRVATTIVVASAVSNRAAVRNHAATTIAVGTVSAVLARRLQATPEKRFFFLVNR